METIPLKNCVKIGFLQKRHGVHGDMYLIFDEEFEESVEEARIFFLKIDGLLVPFFAENQTPEIKSSKRALIKFRWIDTEKKAREILGSKVYLKKEALNVSQQPKMEKLAGFEVVSSDNVTIGTVEEVENFSGNIVLSLTFNGREILLPFNEDLIEFIDREKQLIKMNIPDGLLDLE